MPATAPTPEFEIRPAPASVAYGKTGVMAYIGEERVGWLYWNDDPFWLDEIEIGKVFVQPHHRRKGIATALWQAALTIEPTIQHSEVRTDTGDAWAKSTGDPLPEAHFECEEDRHRHYLTVRANEQEQADA